MAQLLGPSTPRSLHASDSDQGHPRDHLPDLCCFHDDDDHVSRPCSTALLKRLLVAAFVLLAVCLAIWRINYYEPEQPKPAPAADTIVTFPTAPAPSPSLRAAPQITWHQGRSTNLAQAIPGATIMRWMAHPSKCLDVAGVNPGAGLQVWDCDPSYPKQQEFLIPEEKTIGHIRWAHQPNLCLDNPRNLELEFWQCSQSPAKNTGWIISPDGKGRIHLAAKPNLCVDVPEEKKHNGWKLQVWPCHNYSNGNKEDDMRFIAHKKDCCLPVSSRGTLA